MALAEGSSVERIEAAFMGRIADFDTRLLTLAVIGGALQGRTEEQVNLVNAPTMAEERGIVVEEKSVTEAQDFNELIRVTVVAGERARGGRRHRHRPQPRPAPGRGAGPAFDDRAEPFVAVFRYADLPGMIGRVGTIFGGHGINISSAAVGHTPDGAPTQRRAAPRGDGRHDRRARARARSSRRSSPRRASSPAGRSIPELRILAAARERPRCSSSVSGAALR